MVFMVLKRRNIQQLDYIMVMQVPQESAENKYLGHRMPFTLENQCSHRRKAFNYQHFMTKITMKRIPYLRDVGP